VKLRAVLVRVAAHDRGSSGFTPGDSLTERVLENPGEVLSEGKAGPSRDLRWQALGWPLPHSTRVLAALPGFLDHDEMDTSIEFVPGSHISRLLTFARGAAG
jgi:hypothetical protein